MSEVSAPIRPTIPPHVPAELVWNHGVRDFAARQEDPYRDMSRELHAGPDIRWSPVMMVGRSGWLVTRHALANEIYMNTEDFSSSGASDLTDMLQVDWLLNPVEIDPPMHKVYRGVLQPWFQPSAINRLEANMRAGCRDLIDKFADTGSCEFIGDLALQFPSQVFLNLMGMPLDMLDQFLAWEGDLMRGESNEVRFAALLSVNDYLTRTMHEKRRNPGEGDLGSFIATATIEGRPITDGEMMGMALLMYIGGLDTVASSLGWYFRHLAGEPALQDRLRDDPACIPAAAEEFLRAFSPTTIMRTVARDIDFHGVQMRAGDFLGLPGWLYGRDDRVYPDPHRIDFDRKQRHLTLGTGPHNCLGAHLARRELRIVFEEWFARIGNFRIAPGDQAEFDPAAVWSVTRLPLQWEI